MVCVSSLVIIVVGTVVEEEFSSSKMSAVEPVCSFSSGESTANGRLANPCTAALCARELPVTFFGCTTCVPSKTVWRCSHCWKLAMDHLHCLVSANKQREAVPEVMRHPDVKNFFDYDFGDLSVPPPWCQSVPHISQDTFYLHDGCPCCYQVNLPPAPPPTFYYGSVLPSIQSVERQILQMPVLRFHGKFEVMPLVVEIVKVNPVLTTDQELEYQYCSLSFDSTANKNIVTYMHSPAQHVDDLPGSVYIRMIVASDNNQMLSAVVFGVMEDLSQQDLIDFANKTCLAGTIKKNSLGARQIPLTKAAAVVSATDRKVTVEVNSTGSRST